MEAASVADRQPRVRALDDRAEGAVSLSGRSIIPGQVIDVDGLERKIARDRAKNSKEAEPFRKYIAKVIEMSGVRDSIITRRLASNICGAVAKLPFVPSRDEMITLGNGNQISEWDLQISRTAEVAEEMLGKQDVVMTGPARKLAQKALELREQDPEGKKGKAWVEEPFDPERARPGNLSAALLGITGAEADEDEDED